MGWRVAFGAATHRLVGFHLSYNGEASRQATRLVLQVGRAHLGRVLFLRWCHLEHLSVVYQSHVLSGGSGFPLSLELEVQAGHTRLLR